MSDSPRPHPPSTEETLNDRYPMLLGLTRTLAAAPSLDELYAAVFAETSRVMETAGFYISLYDQALDLATIVFYADRTDEHLSQVTYRGTDSEVIRTGNPSLVRDRLQKQSLLVLGSGESPVTRSAISTPMRYRGRVMGALSAQSYEPGAYTQADLELLQAIGDTAAVFITDLQRQEELNRRRMEADKLEEIGRALTHLTDASTVFELVLDAAREILSVELATLWILDEDREGLGVAAAVGGGSFLAGTRLPFAPSVLDELLAHRRPLIFDDVKSTPDLPDGVKEAIESASGILVPLLWGRTVLGGLSAGTRARRRFSDEEAHLLQRLANQAAIALEETRMLQALKALSLTDPLTGLPNRRHLLMHLERELAAAKRGRTLSLAFFDVDGLKGVNDAHGHDVGDRVLARIGAILADETRKMNLSARYGGDEFIAALGGADLEGAQTHAVRVQERVAEDEMLSGYGVSLSFGLATYDPEEISTPRDLIRRADEHFYRGKGPAPRTSGEIQ